MHQARPGGRLAVLEIGHATLHRRVQGVDDHLAINRAGDLHAAVSQISGNAADAPVRLANVLGVWQKLGCYAPVEQRLLGRTCGQTGPHGWPEPADQLAGERNSLFRQDPFKTGFERAENVDIAYRGDRFRHVSRG